MASPVFADRRAVIPAAALGVALALGLACSDGATAVPCSNIPPGGCPIARGVSCEDPACEAVYACRPNNVWQLDHPCPARDASAPRPEPEVDAGEDAPAIPDASFDAPPGAFGGPGCPSLQAPECALGVALSCGAGCCGCEDVFVCASGGWELWGTCADGGLSP